jgi:4-amino-4-deoxy-L-arabinose transferase-like glycosyltransferase
MRSGIDLQVAAVAMNALSAGASVAFTYALGRLLIGSRRLAFVAVGILALSVSLVRVYQMLWSEPLFCAVSLATLCLLVLMVQRGPSWLGVIAVAAGVSFACSLRFVGVVLIPVTGISLFIASADRGVARGLVLGAIGALGSAIGALAAVLRNLDLGAPAFGPRSESTYSLTKAGTDTLSTLGHGLITSAVPPLSLVAGAVVVGLVAVGAIALGREGLQERRALAPILLFVLGYFVLLVFSEMTTNLNAINDRYLSPLFGPIALFAVAGVRGLWRGARLVPWSRAGERAGRVGPRLTAWSFVAVVAGIGIAFLVGNARGGIRAAVRDASDGVGYNAAVIRSSQLAPAAASLSEHLVSNDPVLLYWASGRGPITSRAALLRTGNLASVLRGRVTDGAVTHYAYFYNTPTMQGVSKADLRQAGVILTEVARYQDGVLYSLTLGPVP